MMGGDPMGEGAVSAMGRSAIKQFVGAATRWNVLYSAGERNYLEHWVINK